MRLNAFLSCCRIVLTLTVPLFAIPVWAGLC